MNMESNRSISFCIYHKQEDEKSSDHKKEPNVKQYTFIRTFALKEFDSKHQWLRKIISFQLEQEYISMQIHQKLYLFIHFVQFVKYKYITL